MSDINVTIVNKQAAINNDVHTQNKGFNVGNVLRSYGSIIGMIVVLFVFQIFNHKFMNPQNLINVISQSSILIIMSVGMMMAMSVRAVDLSVAQVADASGVLAAVLLINNAPLWIVLLAPIAFGIVVGCFNGLLLSYLGVPAIIGTLGTMFIIRSIELVTTNGAQPQILFSLPPSMTNSFFNLTQGKIGPVPILIILTIVFIVFAYFVRHRTVFGRHADAVNGNVKATFLSGINVKLKFAMAFVFSGAFAALAGILVASRAGLAVPRGTESYLMDCFVSVYLGTIVTKNNRMSVIGTVIGALFVGLIDNWLTLMGLGADYKNVFNGIIILLALSIGALRKES